MRLAGSEAMRRGPFGAHAAHYLLRLRAAGYAEWSVREKRHCLEEISRWCVRRRVRAFAESELASYLSDRRHRYLDRGGTRTTALGMIAYMRMRGHLPPRPIPRASAVDLVAESYATYLRDERAVSPGTIAVYDRLARPFMQQYFGKGSATKALNAAEVIRHTLGTSKVDGVAWGKLRLTVLRSFLRFAFIRGKTKTDLSAAVPRVPRWAPVTLPKFIPAQQVHRLIRAASARADGGRDRAVLLLLARLGLRAAEVAALTLDDVNWDAGEVMIRSKGGERDRLPLPSDVGRALAVYMRRGRPVGTSRAVFLTKRAPVRPFGRSAVSAVVRRAIRRAGIETPTEGAHLLRHSLATSLLRHGSPLGEIRDLLRHRKPETTMIYAKFDLRSLRKVSPPWPA